MSCRTLVGMASTGEAGRASRLPVLLLTTGLLLSVVAGLGPVVWDATHHAGASEIPVDNLGRRNGEAVLPYVTRVNRAVSEATYHCEPTTPQTWAAALLAPASPVVGNREGILDAEHLRCGFCSQVAFVVADILDRNGVPATGRDLDGHVVAAFNHGGRDYVADPDYAVDPFVAEWGNDRQLTSAVWSEYGRNREVMTAIFVTDADRVQPLAPMRRLAVVQAAQIACVELLRWVAVAAGLLLVAVGLRHLLRHEVAPFVEGH